MFTGWMEINEYDELARSITYLQFPTLFVWCKTTKKWSRRQRGRSIGRILNISPSSGDLYYLRTIITHKKGCRSYDDIYTFAGVTYKTAKESCYAIGLLDEDKAWHPNLVETAHWAYACQLRELFVTMLIFCEVTDPLKL